MLVTLTEITVIHLKIWPNWTDFNYTDKALRTFPIRFISESIQYSISGLYAVCRPSINPVTNYMWNSHLQKTGNLNWSSDASGSNQTHMKQFPWWLLIVGNSGLGNSIKFSVKLMQDPGGSFESLVRASGKTFQHEMFMFSVIPTFCKLKFPVSKGSFRLKSRFQLSYVILWVIYWIMNLICCKLFIDFLSILLLIPYYYAVNHLSTMF